MKHARYKRKIIRLKAYAEKNPAGFKFRLALLVIVGYVAILTYFICLGGIIGAFIFARQVPIRLIILFGFILFVILKMIFQKPPVPDGVLATQERFPALLDLLESAKRATNGPKIHKVILNMDYNAGVLQIPRISMFFGGTRNYLTIGVPLMASLTKEEFQSVLHHEFGHLSKEHSKFHQRVYKAAMIWEFMGELGWFLLLLFYPFVNIYSPLIYCYIAVYQRGDEYEADSVSSAASGSAVCASALYKIHIYGALFGEKIIHDEFQAITDGRLSSEGLLNRISKSLSIPLNSDKLKKYKDQAVATTTAPEDTHPSMMERLQALGIKDIPGLQTTEGLSAFESLFPEPLRNDLGSELEAKWSKDNSEVLEISKEDLKSARETLERLEGKSESKWTEDDYLEFAIAKSTIGSEKESLIAYKSALEKFPKNCFAMMNYGAALLVAEDESGLDWLKKAMRTPAVAPFAAEIAVGYLYSLGKDEEADKLIAEIENRTKEIEKAYETRNKFTHKESYKTHDLSADTIRAMIEALGKNRKKITVAYLVRRIDTSASGLPSPYLFAYKTKSFVWSGEGLSQRILKAFEHCPQEIHILHLGWKGALKKKLKKIDGSQIL